MTTRCPTTARMLADRDLATHLKVEALPRDTLLAASRRIFTLARDLPVIDL